jgi:predicted membrane-bound spermidine synthase
LETARPYPVPAIRLGDRVIVPVVYTLFFTSGFAALLYQVTWQRVLAIFSGADVYSVTIIVAAFMAGLGCGSLAGGYLADRLAPGVRLVAFALAEGAIALFAAVSLPLYHDLLYEQWGALAASPPVLAGVLFLSLLWPTFFMGLSLPLLARALTRRVEGAARTIGTLYGINTLGAAVGAFTTTWFLVRAVGFEGAVQVGAALNLLCAVGAGLAAPVFLGAPTGTGSTPTAPASAAAAPPADLRLALPAWLAIYGLSGFLALTLEIVWFRLLEVMLKTTAFTFGHLLTLFLGGLALGTLLGVRGAPRTVAPARAFLTAQAVLVVYAGLGLAGLVAVLNDQTILKPVWRSFREYSPVSMEVAFGAIGQWLSGATPAPDAARVAQLWVALYVLLPILLIGPPTLLMGMSYPYLQKVVQQDLAHLGRRVGWLQTANILGSLLGTVGAGWVFLRYLGTPATVQVVLALGGLFVVLAVAAGIRRRGPRLVAGGLALVALLTLIAALPAPSALWARLHGLADRYVIAAEDGSGVAAITYDPDDAARPALVYANGLGQSALPYDDLHIMLGLVPVMLHPDPEEVAIIGLGSGATLFGAGGRAETRALTCIEIIAPQLATLQTLHARQPYGGTAALLADQRITFRFTDGRAVINLGGRRYDIIEADALRPTSAYSGNLYSLEYFTLLRHRLKPGGLAVSWFPTARVGDTFLKAFPYVIQAPGLLLIGSEAPIAWEPETIIARLRDPVTRAYYAQAGLDVERYVEQVAGIQPLLFGPDADRSRLTDYNTDLFPKDEYLVPR